jgi:deoxyribose-phosphate aldolase
MTPEELARRIDHALLAPETSLQDVEKFCDEARRERFHSVAVMGSRVELAVSRLEDSGVRVTALVGFPLGAADGDVKRYETEVAVDQGAHEIEITLNTGRLKDGDRHYVLRELRDVAEAADERPVKAVIETHLLTQDEILLACELILDSGAKFVVSGSDSNGALVTVEQVKLLREAVGPRFGVKAAGKIRDTATALSLIEAGADRLGAVSGAALLAGLR